MRETTKYVVRPDADGAKPLSEMEFVVINLQEQRVVNRCVNELEAQMICNFLNQLQEN